MNYAIGDWELVVWWIIAGFGFTFGAWVANAIINLFKRS